MTHFLYTASNAKRHPAMMAVALAAGMAIVLQLSGLAEESSPEEVEQVELGGVIFDVPAPWKGRRIELSVEPSTLVRLPRTMTGNRGIFVTAETHRAFVAMASEALKAGIHLEVDSGFRSYRYQKQILERTLDRGVAFGDAVRWIAPPGYSEHITGQVVDLVPSGRSFSKTQAYQWLREHAADFCFSESYAETEQHGFSWEPWHWRFEDCAPEADITGALDTQAVR